MSEEEEEELELLESELELLALRREAATCWADSGFSLAARQEEGPGLVGSWEAWAEAKEGGTGCLAKGDLPFLGGFLAEFSCPLTSCSRFSSSRFFSRASSSFVLPTGFFKAAPETKEVTLRPPAFLPPPKPPTSPSSQWGQLLYRQVLLAIETPPPQAMPGLQHTDLASRAASEILAPQQLQPRLGDHHRPSQ